MGYDDGPQLSPNDQRRARWRAMDTSGATSGGKFKVDKAHAQKAIDGLNQALIELQNINRDAMALQRMQPPAGDPFTKTAVTEITKRATENDGCHAKANRLYQEQIKNTIDNLTAVLKGYSNAEEMNRNLGGKA